MLSRAILVGSVLLATFAAACSDSPSVATQEGDDPPPEMQMADLPPLVDSDDVGIVFNKHIEQIEGLPVEDAVAWAESSGWPEVVVIDVDATDPEFFQTRPVTERIKLWVSNGIVLDAVAG